MQNLNGQQAMIMTKEKLIKVSKTKTPLGDEGSFVLIQVDMEFLKVQLTYDNYVLKIIRGLH